MSIQKKTSIKSHLVTLADYKIIQEINRGAFGIVFLIEDKNENRFAAKVNLQPDHSTSIEYKLLSREISILMRVEAPTITRFCGFSLEDFQGNTNVTILMKYYQNGSLRQLIERERKGDSPHEYDNTAKQIILCGIAHGMMTLHSRRVLHRDLKPDNVLLDENYHPYITDFGLSKFLDPTNSKSQSMSGCGTAAYMSPEVISDTHYSTKSDVYSFGILMFEVLTGDFAYPDSSKKKYTPFQIQNRAAEGGRPEFKVPIKPSFQKLIEQCWAQDPKDRPTFQELFHKLSLSLEEDDETIESTLQDMLFSDDQTIEFEYLLDDVDTEQIYDYVFEITSEVTKREEELQQLVEEQAKHINSLKTQAERFNSNFEQLQSDNNRKLQEIELLKGKLSEVTKREEKLQQLVEEQTKHINSQERQAERFNSIVAQHQKKIEQLQSENNLKLQEIELLKGKLSELTEQPFNLVSADETKGILLGALTFREMREKINKEKLKDIFILSSMKSIEKGAFSYCSSLTQITIPSSVTSIGNNAFSYCSSLTKITIPASVTSIGEEAFSYCSSLTQVAVPASVTFIGESAFFSCSSLTRIAVPSITSIESSVFSGCTSLAQIEIPSSVTVIRSEAFYNCSSLTKVSIPSSVTEIDNNAFSGCSSLRQITIPSSVKAIGSCIFYNCSSLTQITIPSSVKSIERGTFSGCSSLRKAEIPSSLTSIGKNAFSGCSLLAQITIPSSVESISDSAFSGCSSLTQITIPSSIKSIGISAFSRCSSLTQIVIPSSVKLIDQRAFYSCTSLKQITIRSSVTSIRNDTFANCTSLTQITIPSSVTSIGNFAFSSCSKLTEITIPSSVTSIGNHAFSGCSSLRTITLPSSKISIGTAAFVDCDLPSSVANQLRKRFGPQILKSDRPEL